MKKIRDHGFMALRIEGNILPPEFLQKVAALTAPGQTNADYGVSKSFNIKDEIGRYWRIGLDLWTDYTIRRDRQDMGSAKVGIEEWLLPLLRDVLGYRDIEKSGAVTLGEREFRLSHQADGGVVLFLLTTREFDLDKADSRFGEAGRKRPPHGLIQEFLNASEASLWGLVSNGTSIRLLRDNPSLTRPAYVEADLERMFAEQIYYDFAAFWLLFHASRTRPREGKAISCYLESWRNKASEEGSRALGELRQGVTTALRVLGNGFLQHRANQILKEALATGELKDIGYFQELLRLVYRLLFLFKAEERDLLHAPDADSSAIRIYQEGYALARLRDKARKKRHYDSHADLWQGLKGHLQGAGRRRAAIGFACVGRPVRFGPVPPPGCLRNRQRPAVGSDSGHLVSCQRQGAGAHQLPGHGHRGAGIGL